MFRLLELFFDLYHNIEDRRKIFTNPWLLPIGILLVIVIFAAIFINKDFRHFVSTFAGILRRLLPHTP